MSEDAMSGENTQGMTFESDHDQALRQRTAENLYRIEQSMMMNGGKSNTADYSTLGRLKKNISELGSMVDDMDKEEMERLNKKYLGHAMAVKQVNTGKSYSEGNINTCTDLALFRDASKKRVNLTLAVSCSPYHHHPVQSILKSLYNTSTCVTDCY